MPGEIEGDNGATTPPKKASLWRVAKAVMSAFFGVRKRAEHEDAAVHLTPVQIALAGLLAAAVFVTSLVLLAKFIVGRATG